MTVEKMILKLKRVEFMKLPFKGLGLVHIIAHLCCPCEWSFGRARLFHTHTMGVGGKGGIITIGVGWWMACSQYPHGQGRKKW